MASKANSKNYQGIASKGELHRTELQQFVSARNHEELKRKLDSLTDEDWKDTFATKKAAFSNTSRADSTKWNWGSAKQFDKIDGNIAWLPLRRPVEHGRPEVHSKRVIS